MGTDGERAALVSGRGLYTEEGIVREDEEGGIPGDQSPQSQTHPKPHNILGQFHEDALTQVGVGSYQWLLCATAGFCIMADGVQVFIPPFLETSIQAEMCLNDLQKPWLQGVSMLGLFLGALACPLADHIGRRGLLLFALTIHLIFNILAAFTPTLGIFLVARFGSSFGLGMCYPVAAIYFSEFLPHNARGRLALLLLFWALGGFYVILFASALLPTSVEEVIYEVKEHQSAWHRVLLLSSLPTVFALASLCCLSESIRYLLHAGKDVSAIMMYQQMYKWNASRSAQYQLTELEVPSKVNSTKPPPAKTFWAQTSNSISQFLDSFKQLGQSQNLTSTILLSIIWLSLGFSYYSLSEYAPEKIQEVVDESFLAQVDVIENEKEYGQLYDKDIENKFYSNVTFDSCTFAHISLSRVTFHNCYLYNVDFSNIITSKTYFKNSRIESSRIIDTDFTPDKFIDCSILNSTILSISPPCRMDLDFKLKQMDLITENIIRLLCPFASFIICSICINGVKRANLGAISMILCALISLIYWPLENKTWILLVDFIWGVVFLFGFNAVNIITVETYPVGLRATGFGLCFAWFRAGGCLALYYVPAIPGVLISLILGGLALHQLPDSSHNLM